jgi:hypothetical protein
MLLHVTLPGATMANVNTRVQKHRDSLRRAGLRPVQIWVPDTRQPHFADECRRQSRLIARADLKDRDLQELMEATLVDVDGWTD